MLSIGACFGIPGTGIHEAKEGRGTGRQSTHSTGDPWQRARVSLLSPMDTITLPILHGNAQQATEKGFGLGGDNRT